MKSIEISKPDAYFRTFVDYHPAAPETVVISQVVAAQMYQGEELKRREAIYIGTGESLAKLVAVLTDIGAEAETYAAQPKPLTPAKINAFVKRHQERVNEHFAKSYPSLTPPKITYMMGAKYVRIVQTDSQTSVVCFLDRETGDILKADGWKRPAKGVRGNVYRSLDAGMTAYGAEYAR